MHSMHLISEFICGEKGKTACFLDTRNKVQKIYDVSEISAYDHRYERDWMITTATGDVYCTGRFYDFGWKLGRLKPIKNEPPQKRGKRTFAIYDLIYDLNGGGYETLQLQREEITENERAEANTVLEAFCQMVPEYYYLLEFCHVWGEFLCDENTSDFEFLYESDERYYTISVCLLGQNGYHVSIHCCRKETYDVSIKAS